MKRITAGSAAGLAVTAATLLSGCAGVQVQEVGSMHAGGKAVTLSGLPVREIVSTAGAEPRKADSNGDFETGQMYAHY